MTDQELEVVQRGLASVVNAYGRIVAKDSEGRVIDSGTVTFVHLDGRKLIATANHVVRGLFAKGQVYVQIIREWAMQTEVAAPPREFMLATPVGIDVPRQTELDIAALVPPTEIQNDESIKWFAIERHATALRDLLSPMIHKERTPRLGGMALGFARFSRFEDSSQRVQAAGSVPIWAIFESISDPPAFLSTALPQVVVELEAPDVASLPQDASDFVRASFEQFARMIAADEHALGGYSGGPLIYFCEKGPFVVGIMKEAGMTLGGQGFATPIDVIVDLLRKSPAWSLAASD